jgi:hypothetical protein
LVRSLSTAVLAHLEFSVGEDLHFTKNINNFPQAGSRKIILKYAVDSISVFFMYSDFFANQNIAIWKFHNDPSFLNINKSRFKRELISLNLLADTCDM